jgi:hypothetical protein
VRTINFAACILLLTTAQSARAATYRVGSAYPYVTPSAVPWESLTAGDSVLIHARTEPYHDKWVLCRAGALGTPIVVRGVPDGLGTLPVIDGADAVTRPALNFWSEGRGVIKIGGANSPPDAMPAWIVIENLDIRGGRPENSFTGRNGLTAYDGNAAAIYIEKGQHIVIRGCHLHDCSNGLFAAWQTTDLLVERNYIEDNGNVGSIYEHNNYTEALGIVFQFNRFGRLRDGAGGNNLKDRSAGTVIRYNWIEGGNRQLDLVESDYTELTGDPRYAETFVYGNVLVEHDADGNSQIAHYGGDGGQTAMYRKGTLFFHHNTVISKRTGNTTLLRLSSSGESADVRDNIVYVTATGNRLAMLDQTGALTVTKNWFKTGWVGSHSGGNPDITDNGQMTGSLPGFADYAADDFELAAGSACLDQAVPLAPAVLPDHAPAREYVKHQADRARPLDVMADLGAYEFSSTVGAPLPPATSVHRLRATPNPFSGACDVWWEGPPGSVAPSGTLEVLDARGRLLARVAASAPGRWHWQPPAGLGAGRYWFRLGALRAAVSRAP